MGYLADIVENATNEVLTMMAGSSASVHAKHIRTISETSAMTTGKIALLHETAHRLIILEFSKESLLKVVAGCFGEELNEVDDEVMDTVGEFTNILAGGLGRRLEKDNVVYTVSQPTLLSEKGIKINSKNDTHFIALDFSLKDSLFSVALSSKVSGELVDDDIEDDE